ncbi:MULTISPECIES: GT-D fold domain-containing glycosyltransferase [unclassified Enterococcus]|uniref:GT-D fold domain-containing glycosyltransferase n=1 Tax=unclassified Enterococcus TaxID=2608891 RepID=UPI0019037FCA|nr:MULTISPECIES: GT-D fold domain-containing glycosyltransferase [unclassified Enterococcus]MBK0039167.1 DUF1792 domain-containing protein [Enterococcus sp. S52]MBK0071732.1 DUF1792 domain-containing protein [Enterococcus sp. S53]MBK0142316.1 DUF1792 domain-containing protein [Enterococcus sp. S76]MBK0145731.1 DUF1792 domain-containing protein [Enterococcus sp. S77]
MKLDSEREIQYIYKKINDLTEKDYLSSYVFKINQVLSIHICNKVWRYTEKHKNFMDKIKHIFLKTDFYSNMKYIDDELYSLQIDEYNRAVISYKCDKCEVLFLYNNYITKNDTVIKELELIQNKFPIVDSTTDTLNKIIHEKKSLSRFGDGEFNLILKKDIGFQKHSDRLSKKLIEILTSQKNSIQISIPEFNSMHNNIPKCFGDLSFWEHYWYTNFYSLKNYFTRSSYGNTDMTRNTVFFENTISEIKKIWQRKKVVFVYGNKSRFNTDSVLFENICEKFEIECPATDAFSSYSEIEKRCLQFSKDTLFLISLGPTATVLSYELANLGYQAIDIGHLTSSYEQYLGKISFPESLPIK